MSHYSTEPKWTELALGSIMPEPATSRNCHTGSWRSSRPEADTSRCVKCGVCYLFCPEGCIEFSGEGYPAVGLEYCKGCGICARECWTGCITMKAED